MIVYRPAIVSDCEQIIALHVRLSQKTYAGILPDDYLTNILPTEKHDLWKARLQTVQDQAQRSVLVASDDDRIAGFACFLFNEEPEFGTYLHNLYVSSSYQRSGIARSLLIECIGRFSSSRQEEAVHLLVFSKNLRARQFYDRLGGRVIEHVRKTPAGKPPLHLIRYQWSSANELSAKAQTC